MLHSLSGRAENVMQARLLGLLRDEGPLSRSHLAELMGVSRTTVAAEVNRLDQLGLAHESGLAKSRGGRRSTMVDLAEDARFVGIAIGATRIGVGLTDGRLNVLTTHEVECDIRTGPEQVLAAALEATRQVLDKAGVESPLGCGVGVPGPVDFDRGVSVSPPLMPGWDGYPVRDAVSLGLGCPAVLDNDVNVMAIGELHSGVAKNNRDFLFVKLGTGIGCGIVVSGELYRGVAGCAGDIGHIRIDDSGPTCVCGNAGCLEAYAGGAALAREANAAARSGRSNVLATLLAEKGELTVLQPGPDRDRRPGDGPRPWAARRDARRHLPPLAAAGHRHPPDRAQRAGRHGWSRGGGPPGERRGLCTVRAVPRLI